MSEAIFLRDIPPLVGPKLCQAPHRRDVRSQRQQLDSIRVLLFPISAKGNTSQGFPSPTTDTLHLWTDFFVATAGGPGHEYSLS